MVVAKRKGLTVRPQCPVFAVFLKETVIGIQNFSEKDLEKLFLHPAQVQPLFTAADEANFQRLAEILREEEGAVNYSTSASLLYFCLERQMAYRN